MALLVVGISVLILLVLMTTLRLNGFAALLLVAVGVALVQGIPVAAIPDVLSEGIGDQIGHTMLTIGLGAMVGRVMGDSGAAQRIAGKLLDAFGPRWVQVAMVVTSMLIGVTMFYEVAFINVVPIAFTLVGVTGAMLLWVGLPMPIALSTMSPSMTKEDSDLAEPTVAYGGKTAGSPDVRPTLWTLPPGSEQVPGRDQLRAADVVDDHVHRPPQALQPDQHLVGACLGEPLRTGGRAHGRDHMGRFDRRLMGRHWPVIQRYCNSGRPTVPYCGRRAARPASTRCSR